MLAQIQKKICAKFHIASFHITIFIKRILLNITSGDHHHTSIRVEFWAELKYNETLPEILF